jgi:hypothetical protein
MQLLLQSRQHLLQSRQLKLPQLAGPSGLWLSLIWYATCSQTGCLTKLIYQNAAAVHGDTERGTKVIKSLVGAYKGAQAENKVLKDALKESNTMVLDLCKELNERQT